MDSGCSTHFLRDDSPAVNKNYAAPTITVGTPNGATIVSSCSANLTDTTLPTKARQTHMFPGLTYRSLLAVGQFCDSGYVCRFDDKKVEMQHPTAPTITGLRDPSSGMYLANLNQLTAPSPLPATPAHQAANHVYDMRTKVDLAKYLHLCAWSPVPDTWIKSIENNFFTT